MLTKVVVDKLKSFEFTKKDADSFLFVIAFGGDGAPGCGLSFLVSFINAGKRNSTENFLVFGSNADECSKISHRFILNVIRDIKNLESQVFMVDINGSSIKVEFKLGELPNDMKFLGFLAGELTNAAHYFLTFANVNKDNKKDVKKVFGFESAEKWELFPYEKRLKDAEIIATKKEQYAKVGILEKTRRSKLLKDIKELHSRQEFVPLVEHYIDRTKTNPLHSKNNTVKELFIVLHKLAIGFSTLDKIEFFNLITEACVYSKFMQFVRKTMGAGELYSKIRKWFNEQKGKVHEGDLNFRFRGKESLAYHFPALVCLMTENITDDIGKRKVMIVHEQSILLRRLISYSVRIENFNAGDLEQMKSCGRLLFYSSVLFNSNLSPSLFALTNCSPFHAKQTLDECNFGLGINSMEGREQKHEQIKKYMNNTTFNCRWPRIFRHAYIQLIYLRENGFDQKMYMRRGVKYNPDVNDRSCLNCGFNLSNDICPLCDDILMESIKKQKSETLEKLGATTF